ncbi:uncharacterized protein LOC118420888 isoform X5 [Branchiostoma floridae]|uniref:Uncharacterized protein LOC118420888 isoform X5 n=1 Tax=Branchiostoma floridae TaxID=7739 RepID=A0A9J7LJ25_BRAFL|nr:uncharacterized protein LOC118420888 isoform X5 [Branchiostoma floridae]
MTDSMCQSDVVHGFAAHRDRELSDNLLQTEDDLDQLHAWRAKEADAFCGWVPDPRAPQRRPKDNPANKPAPKRLRSTKERRLSQQNLRATYEFRHYRDIGRYIQQYRRDHSCTVAPRDTNPHFTSDALVALLRKADPQKPYLIPRTRVQDVPGCSLEPPKLGVLRRAVTGTSRDWHSFSGSSVSHPVTEEALPTSHSPPQLSQQIPARGPERVVSGAGDVTNTAGFGLHFTSLSRPSTGTTESRDSGSSSNSNSKSLPNHGTLTLAFSINGNSNRQQRPPSTSATSSTNKPAKPQYTSIVRSEPSADSKQADAASVSDMSATGVNIMAMDRQIWHDKKGRGYLSLAAPIRLFGTSRKLHLAREVETAEFAGTAPPRSLVSSAGTTTGQTARRSPRKDTREKQEASGKEFTALQMSRFGP